MNFPKSLYAMFIGSTVALCALDKYSDSHIQRERTKNVLKIADITWKALVTNGNMRQMINHMALVKLLNLRSPFCLFALALAQPTQLQQLA